MSALSPDRFVSDYLVSQGSVEDRPEYGIVELILDGDSELRLKRDYLKLAYDYDAHLESPGSEFITHGSAIHESVVRLAVEKHTCAQRYAVTSRKPPGEIEKKIARFASLDGRKFSLVGIKQFLVPVLRYKFKLSFLTEQRQEELVVIWIDGFSGKVMDQYRETLHIFFESSPSYLIPELNCLPFDELLNRALDKCSRSAIAKGRNLEHDIAGKADSDMKETEQYFSSMAEEWQMKLTKAKFAKDDKLLQQAQAKLASIEQQKMHHLDDIKGRYSVRCETTLLDVVVYMVPRYRIGIEYKQQRNGQTEAIFWWDEVLKTFCG